MMNHFLLGCCILLSLSVVLSSCEKKDEFPLLDIPEAMVNAVPYQDGQVVKFRDSAGTVHSCIVKREELVREIGLNRVRSIFWSVNRNADTYQQMAGVTLSGNYPGIFFMNIVQEFYPDGRVYISRPIQKLRMTDDGRFICDTITTCHQTLFINGISEQDVVEVYHAKPKLFYSRQRGILRWELESGQSYTRVD